MAGFEFGEKLTCLKKVKIGNVAYKAGDNFPYEEMAIENDLIDSLLGQKKLARTDRLSARLLAELRVEKVSKRIRNFRGSRVAISWPINEPLPKGVKDGRYGADLSKLQTEDVEEEDEPEVIPVLPTENDKTPPPSKETSDNVPEASDEEESEEADLEGIGEVKLVPGSGGWYDVTVNGVVYNKAKLRKRAANNLVKELEAAL